MKKYSVLLLVMMCVGICAIQREVNLNYPGDPIQEEVEREIRKKYTAATNRELCKASNDAENEVNKLDLHKILKGREADLKAFTEYLVLSQLINERHLICIRKNSTK